MIVELLPGSLAICSLAVGDPIPDWASGGPFSSITRTDRELSIVVRDETVPDGIRCERGWRAIRVVGPLDFSEIGILASLCVPLADARISVFAISTFDTDYLLIQSTDWDAATAILSRIHTVQSL